MEEEALAKLLEAARQYAPTPQHREEQRRSIAYGNTAFENELITREMINEQAEKLAAAQKDNDSDKR
jgi:hypothetical protein